MGTGEPNILRAEGRSVGAAMHREALDDVKTAQSVSHTPFQTEQQERVTYTDASTMPVPTAKGLVVLTEFAVCDLRDVRPLGSYERIHKLESSAITSIERKVRKVGKVDRYFLSAHTSGLEVFVQSDSHNLVTHAYEGSVPYGESETKPRVVEIDISEHSVGDKIDIQYSKNFWNAFQAPDQWWAGVTGSGELESYTFLVLFPEAHPYKSVSRTVKNAGGHSLEDPEEDYLVYGPNNDWIWWRIKSPQSDLRYILQWDWDFVPE